jgi:transposase
VRVGSGSRTERLAAAVERTPLFLTVRRLSIYSYRMPRPSRPDPLLNLTPPHAQRFRGGRGRRYVPDVVDRVRVLVEGSVFSLAEIAKRTNVGQTTVDRWMRRRGWQRPEQAPLSTRLVATARSGLGPGIAAAASRLAAVAARLAEADVAAADPETRERAGTIALQARRLAAHLGRIDDPNPPRLIYPPPRRRDLPREAALVAEARHLVERTNLKQSEIARRLGVSKPTLIAWMQIGGWHRLADAPARYGVPGGSRGRSLRNEQRWEARHRLAEAERIIAGLEGGGGTVGARFETAGEASSACDACEAALALVGGAVAVVQRRVTGRAGPEPTRARYRPS